MKIKVAVFFGLIILLGVIWAIFNSSVSQTSDRVKKTLDRVDTMKTETNVLAKKNSSFVEFNQKDYEAALTEGKIVYLEFYANWCPICRAQEDDLIEGINELTRADVAGFRVNFKDDQTDENEKALAAKYKIPYQHHKIVVKDGKVIIDSAETWDAQTLITELTKL